MKRLYVLTRNDLGVVYQSVQGAHAVAQFMLDYPDNEWKNGYLIFLAVEGEAELEYWLEQFEYGNKMKSNDKKIPVSIFQEPDLDNQLTAVAVYSTGTKFSKLPIVTAPVMDEEFDGAC